MTIEERDLSLLIALQENPLAPASKLAKAIGHSTPTVISRLSILKEENSYYNVFADIKPETLELEIIDTIIQIDNIESLEYFEKVICYNHPFTLFRIRCYGKMNGIYAQFRMPIGSKNRLVNLLTTLKEKKIIQDFSFPPISTNSRTIYTKANLSNWEPNLMRWKFDWKKWFSKMEKISSSKISRKNEQSLLNKIDELDIALLEEISKSARRKNTEIMEHLNLDKNDIGLPQKVSRKLKLLDDKIISQYRVFLRWETFEIYNSFLAICECDDIVSFKLQNLLVKEPIPFESTFKITETGFLWYIRCPASHFSDASDIIWRISKKINFYFLDYKKSEFYGLWKDAFDSTNHKWLVNLMDIDKIIK
ncbi:MAG: winged helix-turn-helix transcriptional regulator [Candidatus Heimdallarchaeota archaeon]|nr:winged helix-turn-helix transcriptional regulator [Candidatus Heimdallarchaeota archaeon]